MNLFATVKDAVSPRRAAEHYGIPVTHSGMARCPFHSDHTPSMKLNDTYFYCFGCGAHGDVIDLTARYFGLKPYEAAQKLASDFGIRPDPNAPLGARIKPVPYAKTNAFREDELFCFRVLAQYLHLLEDWKADFAPISPNEPMDDRYIEACQMLERTAFLVKLLTDGSEEERVAKVTELMSNGKIKDLEAYLGRRKEMQYEKAA